MGLLPFGVLLSLGCQAEYRQPYLHCVHSVEGQEGFQTINPPATITFDDVELTQRTNHVYYGSLSPVHAPRFPAVVKCHSVFSRIPAYNELMLRSYEKKDPEYWTLLAKANKAFYEALERTVHELKVYDTVLPYGALQLKRGSTAPGIPDITAEVIQRLRQ